MKRAFALGLVAALGCHRATPREPMMLDAGADASAREVEAGAAPLAEDAGSAVSPPTVRAVGARARRVDTGDWAGLPPGTTIELTWTVHQERESKREPGPDRFFEAAPVELALSAGGKVHRIMLSGNGAGPSFPRCDPDEAVLSFFAAGMSLDFRVERVAPDQLVVTQHQATSDSVDGAGGRAADRFVLRGPPGAHLAQRIVVLGPKGAKEELCAP